MSREQEEHLTSGDLGQHFSPPVVEIGKRLVAPSRSTIISDNWAEVVSLGGHIGTHRIFCRDDAPDRRTVVVFGDSYGFGDEAYPGLSWFLAQVFRQVHFVWVPFGWDPNYLDRVDAELVICQTAERFVPRVPRLRVDVDSLAQRGAAERRVVGLEGIFDDVTRS